MRNEIIEAYSDLEGGWFLYEQVAQGYYEKIAGPFADKQEALWAREDVLEDQVAS